MEARNLTFQGQFYRQIYGTAMRSPVSVIVVNVVMEIIEERALITFSHPPQFWTQYVDDTSVITLNNMLKIF